jgi:Flp pilus assembly protein TadD
MGEPRRIVPRWRAGEVALRTGEVVGLPLREATAIDVVTQEELRRRVEDWQVSRTLGHATDLIASSIALGRTEVARGAAEFVMKAGGDAGSVAIDLARGVLTVTAAMMPVERGEAASLDVKRSWPLTSWDGLDETVRFQYQHSVRAQVAAKIHRLRRLVIDDPQNVLSWLELGRNFARLGQTEKATRAIRAALSVTPDHRFVLRSAARFFLHSGEEEQAHDILRRSAATPHDPWLLAAEIAVATVANRSSRLVKSAQGMLASDRFTPFHTAEMASALATMELVDGSAKRARRLFDASLRDPTENSVAQAQWASHQRLLTADFGPVADVEGAFEAQAAMAYWEGRWDDALRGAWDWLADEPFSGRPIEMATAVAAAALGQPEQAVHFAELGVLANPKDPRLQGNHVFALAMAGRLNEAVRAMNQSEKLERKPAEQVIWHANAGLVFFRAGATTLGHLRYHDAVQRARSLRNSKLEAAALLYWASAAVRTETLNDSGHAMGSEFLANPKFLSRLAAAFSDGSPPSADELISRAETMAANMPLDPDLRVGRTLLASARAERDRSPGAPAMIPLTAKAEA